MPVQMELSRIFVRELTDFQFIELQEVDGLRTFPIAIGLPEAQAIERRLKGQTPPRPQSHDLMASIIESLGGKLLRVAITNLDNNTFFAHIAIEQNGREIEIDSRPSDAIALGVATRVPIYVEESVLARASKDLE